MRRSRFEARLAPAVRRSLGLMALLAAVSPAVTSVAAQTVRERPLVTVGIVLDGPDTVEGTRGAMAQRATLLDLVRSETIALTRREFDVRFPEDKLLTGEFTLDSVRAASDRLLADPDVDLVVSVGALATHDLARRTTLPKPVIGAWAIDIQAQGLPFDGHATGVTNLTYIVTRGSVLDDLKRFHDVVGFSKAHVLMDTSFAEAIPEIPERITAAARLLGIELLSVSVGASASDALAEIPPDAEAVYVTPLLHLSSEEFDVLVRGLIARRLPSFSLLGQDEVERGILGGLRASTDVPRLARRIALDVQRVLGGEDAGTLPVLLDQGQRLMLNMATARAIGVYPSWRVLIEAIQLHPDVADSGPVLAFDEAVRQAVEANLALEAQAHDVAAGAEDIRLARSSFLPRLTGFARGLQIDDDRAAASFGTQAERTVTGGVSLTQLIYSDAARAGLDIARSAQESREQDLESSRLDTALSAADAYLELLRVETLERVVTENLRLTESNLDLAVRREEIGAAGPGDVYRWRAKLANDRSELIAARTHTFEARVALNRLRHRPLEEPFRTSAPGLEDPWLITCCDRLTPFIDNPAAFEHFREFAVREGLAQSVELRSLDAAIAAAERARLAARRDYWAPDIGFELDLERDVVKAGEGSSAPSIPGLPLMLDTPDRNSWSVALQAELPLWQGGARAAVLRQRSEELAALRIRRDALVEGIETRIRLAMFETGITFPTIELAREAAEASSQNLGLVTDAYSKGVVSIISLLDAQNAALSAEEAAANAVYEFLLDLMEVQRATNSFDFFRSEEAREAWLERLRKFFAEKEPNRVR